MWKLILFTSILAGQFSHVNQRKILFVVIDDCEKWDRGSYRPGTSHFSYTRKGREFPLISFGHAWIDEADQLTTDRSTYSDILKSDYVFTSDLSLDEWYELGNDPDRRIFLLPPEDYCSAKRFVYNYQFTVYEVRVHVSASGNDLAPLEIPIAPIPAVDTLRRKKNN
ncbi:hypothetical protein [Algoriphagus sediminis]|uniref:Uncharacterized protein n=1 Tax=Algoriphagus sediminis TaxID=3057113 RepID=A0ABT7YC72_9BACT|nr:hypothetical protein [Algoriphagus sediminis]MDN3204127.1 hypothetical protein [Algoriphagus sediminis]